MFHFGDCVFSLETEKFEEENAFLGERSTDSVYQIKNASEDWNRQSMIMKNKSILIFST